MQADFDVIFGAVVLLQELADLVAEVAFDFKDKAAHALVFVLGAIGEDLLGKGQHAAAGFAAADRAKDGDAGEEAPLRNDEPARILGGLRSSWDGAVPQ